jgi:GMP synthase PP-ATPase subunit
MPLPASFEVPQIEQLTSEIRKARNLLSSSQKKQAKLEKILLEERTISSNRILELEQQVYKLTQEKTELSANFRESKQISQGIIDAREEELAELKTLYENERASSQSIERDLKVQAKEFNERENQVKSLKNYKKMRRLKNP